ncbi:transcriptional regulator, TetR family [Alteribacillus bidgolensis]|uniref:Transcriptional regulator, TetR family n=2 Tax=Alteribacillus bidgolensis TaxID=930129 RepID=A0A1G8EJD8_9BACI|nr:FAD-dependent oxidoreductase [Alteribacillus bidgolensis]SDH69977.1 transcriptional regulator, TetR family [Alteribacillus bidgolensis]
MKRSEKKQQTRGKILNAAVSLFREKGFESTTVQEITETAEVAKGTFFNYFPTKESIMETLAEDRLHEVDEYLRTYGLQTITFISKLRAHFSFFLGEYHFNPELTRRIWQHMVENDFLLLEKWRELLEIGIRREEVKADTDASLWANVINSHFYYTLAACKEDTREAFLDELMLLLHTSLKGILTKRGNRAMKRLVILGGGYGGMRILQRLLPNDLPDDIELVLVDKLPYHCFKTEYYALAAGTESDHDVRVPFPKHDRLSLHFGTVDSIDKDNKLIHMRGEEPLSYDILIIGLGAEDKYHGVPGAGENTYSIQSMEKTRRTYETLNNLPAQSVVSIVGAGLSGVEVASELRESRSDLHIKLFDRGETILPMFPKRLSNYVQNWFVKHEVEVISNSNITKVEKNGLYNHDDFIDSDAIIWTAGVQPNKVVRDLDVEKDEKGRVVLTPHHHLPDEENTFVVGDCASLPHAPSAQLAEGQAEQIAMVLKKRWNNEAVPEKLPKIKLKGVLGSLGKKHGFGVMGDTAVTGRVARLLKSGVLWMYKHHSGV